MTATKDFEFVLNVLKSCETIEQLKTTNTLFENFKNKWKNKLDCYEFVEFMFKFEDNKNKIKR